MKQVLDWIKKKPLQAAIIVAVAWWLWKQSNGDTFNIILGKKENFSTCYQRKQIYLNACDPDEPTGTADVTLEQRWGKLYINVIANLPYARGGVFTSVHGAYHIFLIDSRNNRSINLGSMVRSGDRHYRLSTELLGDYSGFTELSVYRQTEDYAPKKILTGSITGQQCSSL